MSNNLSKITENKSLNLLFQSMINPDEIIKKVSRKTTVTTNAGVHTVWQVAQKSGIATFTHTKTI